MKVLVCCSAAKEAGAGHVMRSLAVAEEALAAGWDVVFAGRIDHPVARSAVAGLGMDVLDVELESAALVAAARAAGAQLIHVDSYGPLPGLRGLAAEAGLALSSMEDGEYGRRPADLVVDASPGGEGEFRTPDGTLRLLRGLRAAPIRRGLLNAPSPPRGTAPPDRLRVLVLMGGTDATGMTARAVRAWTGTGIASECHVVTQAGDEGLAAESGNTAIFRHAPGPDVPLLFGSMDLVISGAGTTVWELAALRVPAAIIQLVPNQLAGYNYAVAQGFAAGLGTWDAWDDGTARDRLRELGTDARLRGQLSRAAEHAVDGAGAQRIVALWQEIVNRPAGVNARRAVLEDASQIFEWRSDPAVRAASRTTDSFSWDSHLAWFQGTLANPGRLLTIIEAEGRPAAVVRFDLLADRPAGWEVSITVSPDFRGTGMGGRALRAAEELLRGEHPDTEITLVAEMLKTNHASRRLFAAAGYEPPPRMMPGTTPGDAPGGGPAAGDDGTWDRLEKTDPRPAK